MAAPDWNASDADYENRSEAPGYNMAWMQQGSDIASGYGDILEAGPVVEAASVGYHIQRKVGSRGTCYRSVGHMNVIFWVKRPEHKKQTATWRLCCPEEENAKEPSAILDFKPKYHLCVFHDLRVDSLPAGAAAWDSVNETVAQGLKEALQNPLQRVPIPIPPKAPIPEGSNPEETPKPRPSIPFDTASSNRGEVIRLFALAISTESGWMISAPIYIGSRDQKDHTPDTIAERLGKPRVTREIHTGMRARPTAAAAAPGRGNAGVEKGLSKLTLASGSTAPSTTSSRKRAHSGDDGQEPPSKRSPQDVALGDCTKFAPVNLGFTFGQSFNDPEKAEAQAGHFNYVMYNAELDPTEPPQMKSVKYNPTDRGVWIDAIKKTGTLQITCCFTSSTTLAMRPVEIVSFADYQTRIAATNTVEAGGGAGADPALSGFQEAHATGFVNGETGGAETDVTGAGVGGAVEERTVGNSVDNSIVLAMRWKQGEDVPDAALDRVNALGATARQIANSWDTESEDESSNSTLLDEMPLLARIGITMESLRATNGDLYDDLAPEFSAYAKQQALPTGCVTCAPYAPMPSNTRLASATGFGICKHKECGTCLVATNLRAVCPTCPLNARIELNDKGLLWDAARKDTHSAHCFTCNKDVMATVFLVDGYGHGVEINAATGAKRESGDIRDIRQSSVEIVAGDDKKYCAHCLRRHDQLLWLPCGCFIGIGKQRGAVDSPLTEIFCFRDFIQERLNANQVFANSGTYMFRCPDAGHESTYTSAFVFKLASPELYTKLNELAVEQMVNEILLEETNDPLVLAKQKHDLTYRLLKEQRERADAEAKANAFIDKLVTENRALAGQVDAFKHERDTDSHKSTPPVSPADHSAKNSPVLIVKHETKLDNNKVQGQVAQVPAVNILVGNAHTARK